MIHLYNKYKRVLIKILIDTLFISQKSFGKIFLIYNYYNVCYR